MLLYCNIANATVVARHDDSMAAVAASAYGTGIRIVPYDPIVSGPLSKVGPAPPNDPVTGIPTGDTRFYGQPVETKTILLAYAAQKRYEKSVLPLNFTAASGVIPVHTDRLSQSLLNNLATYAATLAPTTAVTFTQDNVSYPITAQEAINMFNAVQAEIQAARNIEATCITDLNSATPTLTTYALVDAKFA